MAQLLTDFKDNVIFVLISFGIIVALYLATMLAEHFLLKPRQVSRSRRICIIAACSAIATLMHLLDFPLLFLAPDFYQLDLSELPVMMCGLYLGPTAAITCEAVKILLKLLLKGTSTAFVGDFANFIVGCSLVVPAAIIYHTRRKFSCALWGLITGTVILTVFGSAFNAVYLLPKFAEMFGLPLEQIIAMGNAINGNINSLSTFVLFSVVPLNLIKGVTISVLTLLMYKRYIRPLFNLK